MKRNPILFLSSLILPLLVVAITSAIFLPTRASAQGGKAVTVDYVIGLLDAGVSEADIVARIEKNHLTFRVASGDIDRLVAAGASGHLLDAIITAGVTLENREGGTAQGGTDKNEDDWGRPSRMGTTNETYPPSGETAPPPSGDHEGIEEMPDSGGYYYPGTGYYYPSTYFSFGLSYGYPYYYYPYYAYYPYYYYPAYHYGYHCNVPYYGGGGHGGGYRTVPRGSGGGSIQYAPRGSGGMVMANGGGRGMMMPRGGGGGMMMPHGGGGGRGMMMAGGGGGHRAAPRGHH